MNHFLFSYGTLQLEKVQLSSFGRKLIGHADTLQGYRLEQIEIVDPQVLSQSEQTFHPIAIPSNQNDSVEGTLFEITDEELAQADAYEVEAYKRISTRFESGEKGWVYVKA